MALSSVTRRIDDTAEGRNKPTVITTGLPGIDKFLAGGLRPGQLAVLAARPGYGKSAAALCMARAAAEAGFPTLVVSLEMTADENAERLLAAATSVPLPRLRDANLTPEQTDQITAEMEPSGLAGLPLYVCDQGGLSDSALADLVRTAADRHGVKFVACDYLQLLRGDDAGMKRYQQVGASSRAMKALAKETGVAFLCLAQLNREVENREGGKPRPSDLRDSGEIEQDADVILLLQPLDDDPKLRVHRVDCHVAKQRNGATGTVELDYVRFLTKFEPRSVDR
ncbi:DnaB-like helicase C-terminal domain-containing protein [Limnoglobus roseus]|uniref:Replicative DNA helicase n=1 Tax=Limnoglobus roseus TaxID=2598579 RepID=A0A5C1A821_9BACT|nr:DnaB-like helicase C-terminal domain-containing protein [Limnoglobus roseus]QEL14136.1 replicative DNA helicase [Limnoglobus roseus]